MTIRFILLSLILSLTVDAQAQTFTRGQWTQWGSGSYQSSLTVGDGTIKDFQGNTIPVGTSVGAWGASATVNDVFNGWSQGGVWDLSRNQWIGGMANSGFPTFDLNIFDVPSGTWNPDGRPQRSYSEFVSAGHAKITFPANMSLFNKATSTPAAFVDVNNHYADVADINPTTGTRLLPNVGHHTGSLVWMPTVGRVAWTGSYGYYWSDNGVAPGVWEWDPVTKKWALDIQGTDAAPDPQYNPPVCAVWDSRRNRVLSITGAQTADGTLFAYDPTQVLGRRITRIFTNTMSVRVAPIGNTTGNPACVYDPKRDQFRVYGSFLANGLNGQYGIFSFSSGGGTANNPALTGFVLTGARSAVPSGTGLLYDPVADRDVIWYGGQGWASGNPAGKTLYVVDPDTHIAVALTPSAGADPGVPPGGDLQGHTPSVWSRFAYLPTYDAYAVITRPTTQGVFVFAPDRTSGPLASTRGR